MINMFYCHGFASCFDSGSQKIETLRKLGPVAGCNIDHTKTANELVDEVMKHSQFSEIDVLIGTSMGGWLAAQIGSLAGIPFVAINPAITPALSLKRHLGAGVDYQGKPYTLTETAVNSYKPIAKGGCGLVLLDEGDELFDAHKTRQELAGFYRVKCSRVAAIGSLIWNRRCR
jgi:predicted esterase YcpF (UPF0227 family)